MTIEAVDHVVEDLYQLVMSDEKLKDDLKKADKEQRRGILQRFVNPHLREFFLNKDDYKTLWIEDRLTYRLHGKGIDFGFCRYFEPSYRSMTVAMLGKGRSKSNKCCYNGESRIVSCNGLEDKAACKILHPELNAGNQNGNYKGS